MTPRCVPDLLINSTKVVPAKHNNQITQIVEEGK